MRRPTSSSHFYCLFSIMTFLVAACGGDATTPVAPGGLPVSNVKVCNDLAADTAWEESVADYNSCTTDDDCMALAFQFNQTGYTCTTGTRVVFVDRTKSAAVIALLQECNNLQSCGEQTFDSGRLLSCGSNKCRLIGNDG